MKYETPQLIALTPAINAIQQTVQAKGSTGKIDSQSANETNLAYQDWED